MFTVYSACEQSPRNHPLFTLLHTFKMITASLRTYKIRVKETRGEMVRLDPFTCSYEDNSTEAGFQFTFHCDHCNDGFRSTFIESETNKKGALLRNLSGGAKALSHLFGGAAGVTVCSSGIGSGALSCRPNNMSPEWQKEHEEAFITARNEAQQYFNRCQNCRRWVCDIDFNEDEGMCVECAPR